MRFSVDLETNDAPRLFDRFLQILGSEPWEKRYRILRDQLRTNPLLFDFVARRHGIELAIGRLLEIRSATSLRLDVYAPADYAALSFVAAVVLIYDGLTSTGNTRVAGLLRDGLNTDRGLRPFQSEIATATHLVNAGFDVTFRDLEGEPGFDFLAIRDGAELEVECKSVSSDLGRQVHERRMADLSNRVLNGLSSGVDEVTGGHLIRITLPARLPADHAALESIAASAVAAFRNTSPPTATACPIELRTFDMTASPFSRRQPDDVTQDDVRQFVEEQIGLSNVHTCVRLSPGRCAIVVVVDSQKHDRVVTELVRNLKAAAEQFSRQRPALLVVQFLDLEADAMTELAHHDSNDPAKASALQRATSLFLLSPERSHILTVVYRSHGTLTIGGMGIQEQGPTYRFTNSAHPKAADPKYLPFAMRST